MQNASHYEERDDDITWLATKWRRFDSWRHSLEWYKEKMALIFDVYSIVDWEAFTNEVFVKKAQAKLDKAEGRSSPDTKSVGVLGVYYPEADSSGMGKSRTINEVAKTMFTIPFNVRHKDNVDLAYPPPDDNIRNYFTRFPVATHLETGDYFLVFFTKHFEVVREKLESSRSWGTELSVCWYNYLNEVSAGSTSNREMIYGEVIKRAAAFEREIKREAESSGSSSVKARFREAATLHVLESLKALRKTIHSFRVSRSAQEPFMLIYFDECHVLSERACSVDAEDRTSTMYDALSSALNVLNEFAVFTVFLSIDSSFQVDRNAVPTSRLPYRGELLNFHAPFTELPFDCHPDLPIFANLQPRSHFHPLTLQKICETEFMCMFGRPLFWTRYQRLEISIKHELIPFAESKLRGDTSDDGFRNFDPWLQSDFLTERWHKGQIPKTLTNGGAARFAVLDVRIMLDMESRLPIQKAVEPRLVESHMRVAFSSPTHREYGVSGYPSEPILAEAAARLMHKLRKRSKRVDFIAQIIAQYTQHGLIAKSEGGEMVARLLLTMAYDRAHEHRAKTLGISPRFSDPLSVAELLQGLLGDHWEKIKNAKPDNLRSDTTLEEAFRHAKVRFTHFNRAWDDSGCTVWAAMAAFVRGMAIQCHATKEGIDIILPIFFENENPNAPREIGLQHFSGVLISVKNRERASAQQKVWVDATQINFFPPLPRSPQPAIYPYMVIAMELGVQEKRHNNAAVNPRKRDAPDDEDMQEVIEDPDKRSRTRPTTPIPANTPKETLPSNVQAEEGTTHGPTREGAQVRRPRYTIYIHECSPSVYPVIESRDQYALLLGPRKLLEEYPRNDPDSLDGLWAMKPGWSSIESKECYRWFNGPAGDDGIDVMEEGVMVGVVEGNDGTAY